MYVSSARADWLSTACPSNFGDMLILKSIIRVDQQRVNRFNCYNFEQSRVKKKKKGGGGDQRLLCSWHNHCLLPHNCITMGCRRNKHQVLLCCECRSKVPSFKLQVGHTVALHALPTAKNSAFLFHSVSIPPPPKTFKVSSIMKWRVAWTVIFTLTCSLINCASPRNTCKNHI